MCIRCPKRSQTNWWAWPVVLCLPEYSSGASAQDQHGHSDPSAMATRPSISSGSSGTNSSSASAMISSRSLIADRSGDRGLVNEQQFGDQLLCDVGAEVHDDGFDRLVQRQLPWPTSSVIPNDALPDTLNEFVELLR